ncbi:MAG TPA: zinc ABC transporter substrate-binding protein [Candidatus Merdenecus merdavium]|nr:zinc ABC transporter substrate-binding protein [Candidatus Merdenecus merdavium]
MKKKYGFVALMLSVILVMSGVIVHFSQGKTGLEEKEQEGKIEVLTSFYPMYIATKNVTKDMEHIHVQNMAGPTAGCLHDYQLTPEDMMKLSKADIFVINGGGIEAFMEDVMKQYPELTVINASENIEMLRNDSYEGEGHSHSDDEATKEEQVDHDHVEDEVEDHSDHDHGEFNAHVWMDIDKYKQEVEKIADSIGAYDSDYQETYHSNAAAYEDKLDRLQTEVVSTMENLSSEHVVIFHDAFVYFAKAYGLEVDYVIDMDENTSLSANQVAQIVDVVKAHDIQLLFCEEQYSTLISDSIARETGAEVFILDSLVTGDDSYDSYIHGMEKNMEILKEALQ